MKHIALSILSLLTAATHAADTFIVENGQPRAEIVISDKPQRSARLSAQELQNYVEKISGAHLPIVTTPSGNAVKIFVGRSAHTDALKITAEGLKDGAYRIVSGEHSLTLIGGDTEFAPIEPWAKNNAEIVSGKAQAEWNQITGALWGLPNLLIYKNRFTLLGDTGLPDEQRGKSKPKPMELWAEDERGSFNAVCGFLHGLGVRWYMPGEVGEVVPSMKTIALPKMDETVRPDFPIRRFNVRFGVYGTNLAMWAMRLGLRDPYGIEAAHGMDSMTAHEAVFAAHPDWFALYGGKRRFDLHDVNQLCYSNEELFRETVHYARAQLDHFKVAMVSVMPPDAYTSLCQCKLCDGKDSPERDNRGLLSDHVWDFVNRVAKEVRKTHPNGKILCCAYGTYSLPPLKIAKLDPNVVVSIVGGRRILGDKPKDVEESRKLREAWAAKTSHPIIIFENYPFTDRGWYLPFFAPHTLGAGINATKGMSQGEDIWLSVPQDFEKVGIGFNHFLIYFTQRMYWGGKDADVDAMFREYCRLFYGPAEKEMLAFFEYCEANWREAEKEKDKADTLLALFDKAKSKADAASIHGQRIAFIDDFLKSLRNKSTQLGKKRGPVPVLQLVGDPHEKIVIDGKLDEEAWINCPWASTKRMRELQTGRQPFFGTTVKSVWKGNDLYFAIRCDEQPGEKLNIGTTRKDDSAMWYGDTVEILLETEARSYYQIAVSPSGAIADMDRSAARNAWFSWDSQAEVATHVADDHWTVEIRIPITQDENDPLHQVIGHKPTKSLPWHINVCRQRIRDDGQEHSAFSPTGADHFHDVMKFATLYDGSSFVFDAAEPDADFLEATRIAADLARTGKHAEALAAYTAAAGGKVTDLQKSAGLEQAAAIARGMKDYAKADEIAARIPIEAVKKNALMQNLLDQAKAPQVIEQFGEEDISVWPFWKRGDGYFARARAYMITKAGKEAETDLVNALEWSSETRTRDTIRQFMGNNRETNLHDDTGALTAYREVIEGVKHLGTAEQFTALIGIARILTKSGKFDEAIAALNEAEINKMTGVWHGNLAASLGDTLLAAGRKDEAIAAYQSIIADETTDTRQRKAAEEKITSMKESRP